MTKSIDYGTLMHQAMRTLIMEVLRGVEREGLPGDHHFFITFDTRHPGVEMADWLQERYPEEMTVVMQHWFDNLSVNEQGFAVTLNFGEPMRFDGDIANEDELRDRVEQVKARLRELIDRGLAERTSIF